MVVGLGWGDFDKLLLEGIEFFIQKLTCVMEVLLNVTLWKLTLGLG